MRATRSRDPPPSSHAFARCLYLALFAVMLPWLAPKGEQFPSRLSKTVPFEETGPWKLIVQVERRVINEYTVSLFHKSFFDAARGAVEAPGVSSRD